MKNQKLFESELNEMDVVTVNGVDYLIFIFDHPAYEIEYYAYNVDYLTDYTTVGSYSACSYWYNDLLEELKEVA